MNFFANCLINLFVLYISPGAWAFKKIFGEALENPEHKSSGALGLFVLFILVIPPIVWGSSVLLGFVFFFVAKYFLS